MLLIHATKPNAVKKIKRNSSISGKMLILVFLKSRMRENG